MSADQHESENGVPPHEAARAATRHLLRGEHEPGGDEGPGEGPPSADMPPAEGDLGDGPAAHDVKTIAGLREDAVHRAAEQLCDPDDLRRGAVEAGQRLHGVGARHLFDGGCIGSLYEALGRIRKGAVLQPPQREGTELLKVVASTGKTMELERARGLSDKHRAQWLMSERRPVLTALQEGADARVNELEEELEQTEERLDAALQAAGDAAFEPDGSKSGKGKRAWPRVSTRVGSIFETVRIPPKALLVAAPLEIAATTFLLEGPISNLVATSLPLGSYLIAGAVSASLLGLALVAGFAAVAMRLPARLAGAIIVALSVWLLAGAAAALNLIRLDDERGITILTSATLATALIAAVTAYAATARKALSSVPDERAMLDEIGVRLAPGHPALGLMRQRDRLAQKVERARSRSSESGELLAALNDEIEALLMSSEQTAMRVLKAERAGIEARVAFMGLEATTATQIAQEDANTQAAKAAAELGHRMARAEEIPEEPSVLGTAAPAEDERATSAAARVSRRRKLAVGVLAVGLLLGLVLPSIPVALLGALVAAVLSVPGGGRKAAGTPSPEKLAVDQRPSIVPAADEESPLWRYHPSSTAPKYDRGLTDPTRRT